MIHTSDFSKLGIGTWGIGGFSKINPSNNDVKQIEAMTYMLNRGMNYVHLNYWYAEGKSVQLFKQALKASKKSREDIFIILALYFPKDLYKQVNAFLNDFKTDYVDTIHLGGAFFDTYETRKSYSLVKELIELRKARYTSTTNRNLEQLEDICSICKEYFLLHEIVFNFEIRINEDLGIIKFADKNHILNMVYQPLNQNRSSQYRWPLLVQLAEKYQKSPNQIILNWLNSKQFYPITKSETIAHIDEHLASYNFTIEQNDLQKINGLRFVWDEPKIDWSRSGNGVKIHLLGNEFDDSYRRGDILQQKV